MEVSLQRNSEQPVVTAKESSLRLVQFHATQHASMSTATCKTLDELRDEAIKLVGEGYRQLIHSNSYLSITQSHMCIF